MDEALDRLFASQGGVAQTGQLKAVVGRARFESGVASGLFVPVWTGVYARGEVDNHIRLAGLDLRAGEPVPICLGTASAAYGFDTEETRDLHVLTPLGHQLRSSDGLVVHRREGAPLATVDGRLATAPAWTAIEVARSLRRPRALATLDAALRSSTCDRADLLRAAQLQAGRRRIVNVRKLLELASPLAESAMESESRLIMHDRGLPAPVLQYEIVDFHGNLWRLDFAWPAQKVAVEYDGFAWHSNPEAFRRDRRKRAALEEMKWTLVSLVDVDVRRTPDATVHRIAAALEASAA
ncbi:hypothetical protein [Mycobacterium sp. ACS4331]|uniref:hypothetical protein n=1 Tax=Mycobacterium sp. ACS4331 TaxID=1834121 RepID=UPI00080083C5|nr:hypothetical protein [Mycobacterium sp. ACS4331]OBF26827.1 hypothetical protein A5727_26505 [Mycobacterium sp. ACS4331]